MKNYAPFTDFISKINKTQMDNVKGIDVVMPMYNVRGCSNSYSKISVSLSQYYRDEPVLDNNGAIADFPDANNNSALFKLKTKRSRQNR